MANNKKYLLVFVLCISLSASGFAQLIQKNNWGFNVGAVFAIGNRFQRLGITLQSYYLYNFTQLNAEMRVYRSFINLAPNVEYNEIVTSAGVVFGYGSKHEAYNPFLSNISNQTGYENSVAYSYNAYWPQKVKTRQQTGTLAFQFNNFSIIGENDILGHTFYDRFRTGAFLLQYQYQNKYQFAVNCTMWTGKMGNKIMGNPHFPAGYMDTTGGVYTNYSHGLLSAQAKMYVENGQTLQANLGVDAEQVRNIVQNKLIHDVAFIPRKWFTRVNAHIPMLDTEDQQYLYKENQKIKKPELYINMFSNASVFY